MVWNKTWTKVAQFNLPNRFFRTTVENCRQEHCQICIPSDNLAPFTSVSTVKEKQHSAIYECQQKLM